MLILAAGKTYQHWDDDPDRGAINIEKGAFDENYATPTYLDQGWSEADSLWFYTTTQGSALLPYDLFIALEQEDSQSLFRAKENIDFYRYLPQKPTFFNPDGLPVGFAKDSYQGNDYLGFTCAACHTGQVNYTDDDGNTTAIRIDGGPAMANMTGFLASLEKSMQATIDNDEKRQRFINKVLALNNDFDQPEEVVNSLKQWTKTIRLYNTINHSSIKYGYARLDAFGRIYNRVLQHMINKEQLGNAMRMVLSPTGKRILSDAQIEKVLAADINDSIIGDKDFSLIIERLLSTEPGYPGLNQRNLLRVRDQIFNEPSAPVSYPFLWDVAQSDYVQWNGVAHNHALGPLGRNTGEVIGVFAILDWTAQKPSGFSLSAKLTGQEKQKEVIDFKSSADLVNLGRLESHLKSLKSPAWPEEILGSIDREKAGRGQLLYAQYCQSCHEVVDRNNYDRRIIAQMSELEFIGTDKAMAMNAVSYTGKSGNLKHTVQDVGVGNVFIAEDAPVVQILTSATKGVIATPDPDKWFIRRWADQLYTIGASFFENEMPNTIKNGNYKADTTASPYNSLVAYKARPLNGIWATAPYLHNGSVPTLYDLFLPAKREGDSDDGEYRPDSFIVGSREFDPVKIGFRSDNYDGFKFKTHRVGDMNTGHEYAAGNTRQMNGDQLPALTEAQRWDLIEYIKTL
jgi:cytochrome c5